MRAETQAHVDAIQKSLALLAQRMDWETAPHRLEEFNALIEQPDLWNDPAKAQKLMRERQSLMDAVNGYKLIEGGLNDNLGLIELGEAEGEESIVTEAEGALRALVEVAAQKELDAYGIRISAIRRSSGSICLSPVSSMDALAAFIA